MVIAMADLIVTDAVISSTSQLIRNLAGEPALSPAIRRYTVQDTGSYSVASAISQSQELRRRLTDIIRENIVDLARSVDTAGLVLAETDESLSEPLP